MASWSQSDLAGFIELFRSEECLWKVKSSFYSNRLYKERAYNTLLEFVHTFDIDATKDSIIRKINTIRSSFRKEYKKVQSSRLSGCGADEVYMPKLWYYADLLFLQDQEQPWRTCLSSDSRPTLAQDMTFNQETDEDGISVAESTEDLAEGHDVCDSRVRESSTSTPEPRPEAPAEPRPGPSNMQPVSKRGSKRKSDEDELKQIARQRLLNPLNQKDDQFDLYGKLVAHKMRNLPNNQRILSEKLCNDVLLYAELGTLTTQTNVVNQSLLIMEQGPKQ